MTGRSFFIVVFFLLFFTPSDAYIRMPVIFQSNMVLQRNKEIKIWGWGAPGENINLDFKGSTYKTKTGKEGKWLIGLPAQPAGGPYTLQIKGKENSIVLNNLLIGDVWICGGQSNMQFSVSELEKLPAANDSWNNNLRLFTTSIGMDYVGRDDLEGGSWKEATPESTLHFSAVAYFFGKMLQDSLHVPIGLISDNLGATSVETWMSPEALSGLKAFQPYYKEYLEPGQSFAEVTDAFNKMKPRWEKKDYLKGRGMDQKWYLPQTDISGWKTMEIPAYWEDEGLPGFDGAVWFRKSFDLPEGFRKDSFLLALNQIDDYDIVWVNGHQVGEGFGNQTWRNYQVPANILHPKGNVLVVRVFDAGGKGGMYSNAIWGNSILLGKWKYQADDPVEATSFPKPHVVNVSPFSSPSVLYNANIAPLTGLGICGVIWYQGESNASRAEEYRTLFPGLIRDWRTHFKQGDFPFLWVQLANYMSEAAQPVESDWAELRDAQSSALSLPQTGMATAIDIGQADNIHPKNKMEVGRRLGLAALRVAYHHQIVSRGPTFDFMEVSGDSAIIHYKTGTNELVTTNKYSYVSGFALMGSDHQYHWAKAFIRQNTVVVFCHQAGRPEGVRYGWSDNPGKVDLYNSSGLPALPFRTDSLPLKTSGKVFSQNPWELN